MSGDSCSTGAGGGGTTTLSAPRYQLAEYRYGREEMLALYDRNHKPPEPLTTFVALYVEKAQPPLALIQMTEDEAVTIHLSPYLYFICINPYYFLSLSTYSLTFLNI